MTARRRDSRLGVLLVAELRLDCDALAAALEYDSDFNVLGFAVSLEDAVRATREFPHDVTVIRIPGSEGLVVAHALRMVDENAKLVVCGVSQNERELQLWASAGVLGYLGVEATLEELVAAIVLAARGEPSGSDLLARGLFRRTVTSTRGISVRVGSKAVLTPRESEVLHLIARGLSNKQVARALSLQVPTVKNHVHNILSKLHVRGRAEAIAWLDSLDEPSADPLPPVARAASKPPAGDTTTDPRSG